MPESYEPLGALYQIFSHCPSYSPNMQAILDESADASLPIGLELRDNTRGASALEDILIAR